MSDIRYCDTHGFFQQQSCPLCSTTGTVVVSSDSIRTYSGFLSKILRHTGLDHDLEFTTDGWTDLNSVAVVCEEKIGIGEHEIRGIVASDKKGRYEITGDQIRAGYGHSIDSISIEEESSSLPDVLYHGTAPRFKQSILSEGLTPQGRNVVHLTSSRDSAINVGRRHSNSQDVLLFEIETDVLSNEFTISNPNGDVYTVSCVPPTMFKQMLYVDS